MQNLMPNAAGAVVSRSAQATDARPHSSYRTALCRRDEATERDTLTGTRLAVDRLVGRLMPGLLDKARYWSSSR